MSSRPPCSARASARARARPLGAPSSGVPRAHLLRGVVQGRPAVAICRVQMRAKLQEMLHRVLVSGRRREVQRRDAHGVGRVHVRAELHQQGTWSGPRAVSSAKEKLSESTRR